MNVLIAGCGYLGTAAGARLVPRGAVYGLRRRASGSSLERAGIRPVEADLSDPATLKALPACDVVVFAQAPSRPDDDYASVYVRGTRNLIGALKGRPRAVFVSSTGVYGTQDGSEIDEKTLPDSGSELLQAEKVIFESGMPAMVLRLGGIYGPGRNHVARIREGTARPFLTGKYTNRIHVEDAAAAIEVLIDKGRPGEVYLGVDDKPCTQKEFYEWLYSRIPNLSPKRLFGPGPKSDSGPGPQGKRCSNRKLRALGWKPLYPSYREGYEAILKEEGRGTRDEG